MGSCHSANGGKTSNKRYQEKTQESLQAQNLELKKKLEILEAEKRTSNKQRQLKTQDPFQAQNLELKKKREILESENRKRMHKMKELEEHFQSEKKESPLTSQSSTKTIKVYPNGDKYVGDMIGDQRHGTGTMYYIKPFENSSAKRYIANYTSAKYEGEWKHDKKSGYGVFSFKGGNKTEGKYEGQWENDKRHGKGKETQKHSNDWTVKYEGQWKNDEYNGEGKEETGSPSYGLNLAEGTWKDGNLYKGIHTYPTGHRIEGYNSKYEDIAMSGEGAIDSGTGVKYVGKWEKGLYYGQGVLYEPHGSKYEGNWEKGKKHGRFVMTTTNGEKIVGEYQDDIPKGIFTLTKTNGHQSTMVYDEVQNTWAQLPSSTSNEIASSPTKTGNSKPVAGNLENNKKGMMTTKYRLCFGFQASQAHCYYTEGIIYWKPEIEDWAVEANCATGQHYMSGKQYCYVGEQTDPNNNPNYGYKDMGRKLKPLDLDADLKEKRKAAHQYLLSRSFEYQRNGLDVNGYLQILYWTGQPLHVAVMGPFVFEESVVDQTNMKKMIYQ